MKRHYLKSTAAAALAVLTLCSWSHVALAVCFGLCASTASAALVTSTSSTAPTTNVAIQQATSDGSVPWRFQADAGVDNNPRDAGQTFLVGSGGLVLDAITVRVATLGGSSWDGQSFTLGLYDYTDASDVVPDPDKDSPIFTESGVLPASFKSDFDGGADFLTIDLTDQNLAPGQYGFLLMLDSPAIDNMTLAGQSDGNSYADGLANRRQNRGAVGDAFSAQEIYVAPELFTDVDMEFYLQQVPEPCCGALLSLGGLGLVLVRSRRAR